jgi:hypothetical protein
MSIMGRSQTNHDEIFSHGPSNESYLSAVSFKSLMFLSIENKVSSWLTLKCEVIGIV